jgi:hypothetical protein
VKKGQGLDGRVGRDRRLAMLKDMSEAFFTCSQQVVGKVIRLIEQRTHMSFPLSRIKRMNLLLLCLFLNR